MGVFQEEGTVCSEGEGQGGTHCRGEESREQKSFRDLLELIRALKDTLNILNFVLTAKGVKQGSDMLTFMFNFFLWLLLEAKSGLEGGQEAVGRPTGRLSESAVQGKVGGAVLRVAAVE